MFVGFIMRVNVPAPVLVVEKFDPNIYHEPACWIYALALRGDSWVYELKGNNIA